MGACIGKTAPESIVKGKLHLGEKCPCIVELLVQFLFD